jgi:hypothetical protein
VEGKVIKPRGQDGFHEDGSNTLVWGRRRCWKLNKRIDVVEMTPPSLEPTPNMGLILGPLSKTEDRRHSRGATVGSWFGSSGVLERMILDIWECF